MAKDVNARWRCGRVDPVGSGVRFVIPRVEVGHDVGLGVVGVPGTLAVFPQPLQALLLKLDGILTLELILLVVPRRVFSLHGGLKRWLHLSDSRCRGLALRCDGLGYRSLGDRLRLAAQTDSPAAEN